MADNIVADDIATSIKLVQEVEKYGCLYDYSIKSYSNDRAKTAAWVEISKSVNMSVSDCKEKWRNIRGRFLRQIKDQPPSGSGVKKNKKQYYLNEYLQFIEPYTKSRCQTGNLQPQGNSDDGSDIEVNSEDVNDNIGTSVISPDICTNKRKEKDYDTSMKKKKSTSSLDELNKVATNYFMNKKIAKDKVEENDDPDMNFLKSLLPDIKMLNPQAKRILKMDMMKLVHDANDQMLKNQVYQERAYQPSYNLNQPGNMLYQPHEIMYFTTDTNDHKNNQTYQAVEQPTYWRPQL